MTCTSIPGWGIVCSHTGFYRLPLADGRRVYLEWYDYLGPVFFLDRAMERPIERWYEDQQICDALDWFIGRGRRA